MTTLEITLREASRANEALTDNRILFSYLEQTSSNTYDFKIEEGSFMDEEQLQEEITNQLLSAGIEEEEFWFYNY